MTVEIRDLNGPHGGGDDQEHHEHHHQKHHVARARGSARPFRRGRTVNPNSLRMRAWPADAHGPRLPGRRRYRGSRLSTKALETSVGYLLGETRRRR